MAGLAGRRRDRGALVLGRQRVRRRRAARGPTAAASSPALIALAALAIAGLSVLLQPLGLVALAAIVYLGLARRSRAARKYEGLRTLR